VDFDAFKSPNFEALVKVGINIGERIAFDEPLPKPP